MPPQTPLAADLARPAIGRAAVKVRKRLRVSLRFACKQSAAFTLRYVLLSQKTKKKTNFGLTITKAGCYYDRARFGNAKTKERNHE